METVKDIFAGLVDFLASIPASVIDTFKSANGFGDIYTAFARWIFILLALFILLKSIMSLLKSKNPSEVYSNFL